MTNPGRRKSAAEPPRSPRRTGLAREGWIAYLHCILCIPVVRALRAGPGGGGRPGGGRMTRCAKQTQFAGAARRRPGGRLRQTNPIGGRAESSYLFVEEGVMRIVPGCPAEKTNPIGRGPGKQRNTRCVKQDASAKSRNREISPSILAQEGRLPPCIETFGGRVKRTQFAGAAIDATCFEGKELCGLRGIMRRRKQTQFAGAVGDGGA